MEKEVTVWTSATFSNVADRMCVHSFKQKCTAERMLRFSGKPEPY